MSPVLPRLVVFSLLGTFLSTSFRFSDQDFYMTGEGIGNIDCVLIGVLHSDGIARVHGMSNVQAEELVE